MPNTIRKVGQAKDRADPDTAREISTHDLSQPMRVARSEYEQFRLAAFRLLYKIMGEAFPHKNTVRFAKAIAASGDERFAESLARDPRAVRAALQAWLLSGGLAAAATRDSQFWEGLTVLV